MGVLRLRRGGYTDAQAFLSQQWLPGTGSSRPELLMNLTEALTLVIHEGTAADGIVVETRAAMDPGMARVRRLLEALRVLTPSLADEKALDRRLANALYGLSFHLSTTLEQWQPCDWINEYTEILEEIEAIFAGESRE